MIKPVSQWTENDLQALIGERESSSLEFKSAAALDKNDHNRRELVKDVTALANAAGGMIIYGIIEKGEVASQIDGSKITGVAEWIDQITSTNIEPKIRDLRIHSIPLKSGGNAYVIEIPQSMNLAPHQSMIQKLYFRRYNTTSQPMLDHEIRDLMRRGTSPSLSLELSFVPIPNDGNRFVMLGKIQNSASEPSLYTSTILRVDTRAAPNNSNRGFDEHAMVLIYMSNRIEVMNYSKSLAVPHCMPIFAEQPMDLYLLQVTIAPYSYFYIEYRISAPGCLKEGRGYVTRLGNGLPYIDWHD